MPRKVDKKNRFALGPHPVAIQDVEPPVRVVVEQRRAAAVVAGVLNTGLRCDVLEVAGPIVGKKPALTYGWAIANLYLSDRRWPSAQLTTAA